MCNEQYQHETKKNNATSAIFIVFRNTKRSVWKKNSIQFCFHQISNFDTGLHSRIVYYTTSYYISRLCLTLK